MTMAAISRQARRLRTKEQRDAVRTIMTRNVVFAVPWRLESARNVTAIRRGNTVFRGADLSPAAVATTIGVETAREFFARETTEAPMSRRPIPHIPIHPLRLAFWLSSGWFWFQWWQREALLAMQTIERQLRPEARLALVRAEIPQEKRA